MVHVHAELKAEKVSFAQSNGRFKLVRWRRGSGPGSQRRDGHIRRTLRVLFLAICARVRTKSPFWGGAPTRLVRTGAGVWNSSSSDGATGLGLGLVALRQPLGAVGRVPCFLVGQLSLPKKRLGPSSAIAMERTIEEIARRSVHTLFSGSPC